MHNMYAILYSTYSLNIVNIFPVAVYFLKVMLKISSKVMME